ncbi:YceI family protein [Aurantiacibacter gangjinensis]|uniref:YceI family protein n=1 Tax=Aurantiacibacter gangjinensis TaxID=502682 RepID=UPI00069B8F88|nr:YceI family protein [Aurantiacibacter gangjinensis]APE28626.1 hypothetical protein BMF35_a1797 [Aurantiacibacter gangjinensis]
MRKTLFAFTAAGTLAACATAAATTETVSATLEGVDTAGIRSGTYRTDPAHTLVEWRLSHFGFNDYFGLFGDAEGVLELDRDNLSNSSVDITLPITSLAVVSEGLREHMLRPGENGGEPDFFGPDPDDARFVSTSVVQTSLTTANIFGNLTLNGRTAPVVIAAELSGQGDNPMNQKATVGFHGTTTIMRSQWGLDFGVPMGLGDEVALDITVAFEKD